MENMNFAEITESLEATINVPHALIAAGIALLVGFGIYVKRHMSASK